MIERVLLGQEMEIPEDTVVAYDDFPHLARRESGTDVGGFDVADDLDPAANPQATQRPELSRACLAAQPSPTAPMYEGPYCRGRRPRAVSDQRCHRARCRAKAYR
ncbi:hypothetical protein [Streptomyces bottropensis]|uniref:hypothetical protein n=1 Tax=Streptomyces bottropensis TaxID=42235 RepID=UPI0036A7189D